MTPDDYAAQVAEIAKQYAYRRKNHIDHTGHTVHRLLSAVSKLLGKTVVIQEEAHEDLRARAHITQP